MTTQQTAPVKACSAQVYASFGFGHGSRCSRTAKVVEGGKPYCTQHAPSTVEARRQASHAKWEAEDRKRAELRQQELENRRRAAAYPSLLDAVKLLMVAIEKPEHQSFALAVAQKALEEAGA